MPGIASSLRLSILGAMPSAPEPSASHAPSRDQQSRLYLWRSPWVWIAFALLAVVILKSAWLSEDSYISFRAIDHFVGGHGLNWNVSERVQVYTNPLWVLIISAFYFFTGEFVVTLTILAWLVSLGAAVLALTRLAATLPALLAGVVILIASRAWIDYSTSGLENPMTFLMLAAFLVTGLAGSFHPRRLPWLILFGSLCALNRLDTVLLTGPLILYAFWQTIRSPERPSWLKLFGQMALASFPLWGWLLFSTVYYGFPLPNTYYAKLTTGIPKPEYYQQGFYYYANTLRTDAVTLLVIGVGLIAVVVRREWSACMAALGVMLYLAYIISVGGDFMRGRFFAAPLFVITILIVRFPMSNKQWLGAGAVVVILGLIQPQPALFYHPWQGVDWAKVDAAEDLEEILATLDANHGIADERAFAYQSTGLLPLLLKGRIQPRHPFIGKGRSLAASDDPVAVFGNTGFAGFYAGSNVHIIDDMGLCDALIARLPVAPEVLEDWRVGHYRRDVPTGYVTTVRTGRNQLTDPRVSNLYESLDQIIAGPIWSPERWREIWRWNSGHYQSILDDLQSNPPQPATS